MIRSYSTSEAGNPPAPVPSPTDPSALIPGHGFGEGDPLTAPARPFATPRPEGSGREEAAHLVADWLDSMDGSDPAGDAGPHPTLLGAEMPPAEPAAGLLRWRMPRALAFCCRHVWLMMTFSLLLLAIGAAIWGLSYHSMTATQAQLRQAEQRLRRAEARNEFAEQRILATEARLRQARQQLQAAISAVEARQSETYANLSEQVQQELLAFRSEAEMRLAAIASLRAREERELAERTRLGMEALREELMVKLTGEYERLRVRGDALIDSLASRADEALPANDPFKRSFAVAREAILFIRTDYNVRLSQTGEVKQLTSFGTGFLISPVGVGMTAQHVAYPWRYNKRLRAAVELGTVEVLEDSLTLTMWLTDSRVLEGGSDETFRPENGYRMGGERQQIRILYAGTYEQKAELVPSALGFIPLNVPRLGKGDLVVFQILDFSRRFPYLSLAADMAKPAPLDDVMVVGYPLSRLAEGIATPQPSRGRVRRVGAKLMELDSPLHPGNSGGPILDRAGRVVGLASAILDSPVFGVAVRGKELRAAWRAVRSAVRAEQVRLRDLGCDPGPVDGVPGKRTWEALQCEAGHLVGR